MEVKLFDMGNGAVALRLAAPVAKALNLASGTVVQVTIKGDELRVVRQKASARLDPNEVTCSNLWEHAAISWASVGPRR